ncbi:hypothetical protein L249_0171 [Ophiocordyceps polyrhachis-furcata BCC 54312]|uniref:Uncharacterized protein n=1 Tax=Ophiocordyceps polyrhachis-furcata BCC 54312 TaxID=1330021 RepID=A0A367LDK1_9HYPO|nr:hypothetical protein L249_0171 [Ophiocordyceps polyrhachis-furcata BCC 54312]
MAVSRFIRKEMVAGVVTTKNIRRPGKCSSTRSACATVTEFHHAQQHPIIFSIIIHSLEAMNKSLYIYLYATSSPPSRIQLNRSNNTITHFRPSPLQQTIENHTPLHFSPKSKKKNMHLLSITTLALTALTSTANARTAAHSSISQINDNLLATEQSVSNWAGGLLTMPPVLMRAKSLMDSLNAGVVATKSTGTLTEEEAKNLVELAKNSGESARQLSDSLVSAKSKFAQIPLADVFVSGLMSAYGKRTEELGSALEDKVPEANKRVAEAIESIQDSIKLAQEAYTSIRPTGLHSCILILSIVFE